MAQVSRRRVDAVVRAHRQLEGGGFPVRRPFPTAGRDMVDPFLLLDEMGPVTWEPGQAIGAPDHPHRGFETVTYMLAGKVRHRDSTGHDATIGPGGVQWMTAGAGIVHSEMPDEALLRNGGPMHGFQLWVNLPRQHKAAPPRYQTLTNGKVPQTTTEDGLVHVRVIAGESLGTRAVIDTHSPIVYLHFTLRPGGQLDQPLPAGHAAFVYVFGGASRVGGQRIDDGDMAVLDRQGTAVSLACDAAESQPAELLLIAGAPLEEPVARFGPFVMNNQREILEAVRDYQAGRMGKI